MKNDQIQESTAGEFTVPMSDPDDRRMLGMLCRLHADPPRLYGLHDIKRTVRYIDGRPQRQIHTLTSFQPKLRRRPDPALRWYVITYDIDDVAIRFKPCMDAAAAQAAFDGA